MYAKLAVNNSHAMQMSWLDKDNIITHAQNVA